MCFHLQQFDPEMLLFVCLLLCIIDVRGTSGTNFILETLSNESVALW